MRRVDAGVDDGDAGRRRGRATRPGRVDVRVRGAALPPDRLARVVEAQRSSSERLGGDRARVVGLRRSTSGSARSAAGVARSPSVATTSTPASGSSRSGRHARAGALGPREPAVAGDDDLVGEHGLVRAGGRGESEQHRNPCEKQAAIHGDPVDRRRAPGLTRTDRMGQSRAPRSRPCGGGLTASPPSVTITGWRTSPSTSTGSGAPAPVEAVLLDGFRVGEGPIRDAAPPRLPRADPRSATGRGRAARSTASRCPCGPGTVTVIGQGQVHQFRWARGPRAARVVRFTDEALRGRAERVPPRLAAERPRRPDDRAARRASSTAPTPLVRAARRRGARGRRTRTRRACSAAPRSATLLLWLERWYDGVARRAPRGRGRRRPAAPRASPSGSRHDFARHHDVAHYADALARAGRRARPRAAAA